MSRELQGSKVATGRKRDNSINKIEYEFADPDEGIDQQ